MTIFILACTETLCFVETNDKMPFVENSSVSSLFERYYRSMTTESFAQSNFISPEASTKIPLLANSGNPGTTLINQLNNLGTQIAPIEDNFGSKIANSPPNQRTSQLSANSNKNKTDKYANGCLDFLDLQQDLDLNNTNCLGPLCCRNSLTGNSVQRASASTDIDRLENSNVTSVNNMPDQESNVHRKTFENKTPKSQDKTVIHIGGLFELTGSRSDRLGLSELSSAKLAIEHVNRADFLEGYTLNLLHNDTRVCIQMSLCVRKPTIRVPIRSDTKKGCT